MMQNAAAAATRAIESMFTSVCAACTHQLIALNLAAMRR
jgi:hypothetical protein